MARRRRPSVRLWQTELFVIVIVVAILILSTSLSSELQRTLKQLGERDRLSAASALALTLGPDFPITETSRPQLREHVLQFRLIYGDDVWVYTPDGTLVYSAAETRGPDPTALELARVGGLGDSPPYSKMTLAPNGFAIAGKAIYDAAGKKVGSVVVAERVTRSLNVLNAVRDRLWITFWIALTVSGLLGFGFAEFIGRRVRRMSKAAADISAGDFNQQLPTGLVPDELYELADSYNTMAKTLGQTFEAQRRFVANASHEMRTPIAALKGLLELLESGAKEDPAVRDDFLRTMSLEVDRLGRLVGDLLTLAQLEAGSLTLHTSPVAVDAMLLEIATVMRPLAERSGIELVTELPIGSLEVTCDRDRIQQVLLGFVDNAIKYSPRGTAVTIAAIRHADRVTLEVRDHGAGIEPDLIPHLAERFYRVDESRGIKGTGLGLAIAKEIIEAHGSTIEVTSQVGEGSTFAFDLRLEAPGAGAREF